MKHCPACKQDYAEKFDQCFACGGALAPGSIESGSQATATAVEAEQSADASALTIRQWANDLLLLSVALGLGGAGYAWLTETGLPIRQHAVITLESSVVPEPIPTGGALRTTAEAAAFRQRFGAPVPEFTAGSEMLVYYPIQSAVVWRRRMPAIVSVDDLGPVVKVVLAPSREPPPAILRLAERVTQSIPGLEAFMQEVETDRFIGPDGQLDAEGLAAAEQEAKAEARRAREAALAEARRPVSRPELQLLAVARVGLAAGVPTFEVDPVLLDPEAAFDPASLGGEMAGDFVGGFLKDFGILAGFGFAGLAAFFLAALKVSARSG